MLKFQTVAEKTAKKLQGATFFAAPCICTSILAKNIDGEVMVIL